MFTRRQLMLSSASIMVAAGISGCSFEKRLVIESDSPKPSRMPLDEYYRQLVLQKLTEISSGLAVSKLSEQYLELSLLLAELLESSTSQLELLSPQLAVNSPKEITSASEVLTLSRELIFTLARGISQCSSELTAIFINLELYWVWFYNRLVAAYLALELRAAFFEVPPFGLLKGEIAIEPDDIQTIAPASEFAKAYVQALTFHQQNKAIFMASAARSSEVSKEKLLTLSALSDQAATYFRQFSNGPLNSDLSINSFQFPTVPFSTPYPGEITADVLKQRLAQSSQSIIDDLGYFVATAPLELRVHSNHTALKVFKLFEPLISDFQPLN